MSTAGYSGTPLPRKLGIGADSRLLLVGAPAGIRAGCWAICPPASRWWSLAPRRSTSSVLFARDSTSLHAHFAPLADALLPAGGLWVAWPKRSSGVATELGENAMREVGLTAGLVDNKVCAIDATWSGLRFVRRLRDRPGRT